jgi:hypothetical protein
MYLRYSSIIGTKPHSRRGIARILCESGNVILCIGKLFHRRMNTGRIFKTKSFNFLLMT